MTRHFKQTTISTAAAIMSAAVFAFMPRMAAAQTDQVTPDMVTQGEYLVRAAGCIACHTDEKNGGATFAGQRGLETPFGTFYSPNITPDVETGIGGWSDDDFITALRHGTSPEGYNYFPVFPYPSYTMMRDEDMLAIKAYLFSLEPVTAKNRDHDVGFPFNWRFSLHGWKLLNFTDGALEADAEQGDDWNRGRYLVKALAHCGECHTPRDITGAMDDSMFLAGNAQGPDGELVPNITPAASGIGDWSIGDITTVLADGTLPGWDNVQGSMAEAIRDGLSHLTKEDRTAIAVYLKSIPAIENTVKKD